MPNEPPTSGAITRTRCSGRSKSPASTACIMCGTCVEIHTVSERVAGSKSARSPRGSIGTPVWRPVVKRRRQTRAAVANAASGSPPRSVVS